LEGKKEKRKIMRWLILVLMLCGCTRTAPGVVFVDRRYERPEMTNVVSWNSTAGYTTDGDLCLVYWPLEDRMALEKALLQHIIALHGNPTWKGERPIWIDAIKKHLEDIERIATEMKKTR
jgi:hypothetical protein